MEKSFIKKHKQMLIALLVTLIVLISSSYAWFFVTIKGEKKVVIHAGKLSLNLDEKASDGINLTNAIPLTDQEGLHTTSYDFTLKNDGTLSNQYTIYLEDITTTTKKITPEFIKYDLKQTEYNANNSIKIEEKDTMQLLSAVKTEDKLVLDSGILKEGEYIKYSFRLWMDYNAGNEYQDSGFKGKLKIVGTQLPE